MFSSLMANTWIAASIVAVIAGITGFFAVLRGETFAAHAIPNGAFAGAAGAALLGVNVIWGLAVFAIAGALGIGILGSKARHDVVTALALVLMLGLGALFVGVSSQYAQQAYSLLFGEVYGVASDEVWPIAGIGLVAIACIAVAFRRLMLTSAMPEVAQARGVSVRGMEIFFLVVMALATSMTVPVVGALLMFSLMIGPAAAARSVTARPGVAIALSVAIALATVWLSIALSYRTNWPLGFFVGIGGAAFYLIGLAARPLSAHRTAYLRDNRGVRATLLGPFDLQNDSGESLPLAGSRLRDLVARLALAGGKPVSTSALAEAVWAGAPPSDLANALQTLVSRARRALGGPATVEQSAAGYRLAITPGDVDALRFERLVGEGAVEEALALWRGPALDGLGEFAAPYALRLHELKLDATVTWLARELDGGRAAAHVAELEALAAADPLNEKVAALLMRALAATGRQADALAAHEALRARLADELGIDPGPELRAAHLAVVRGEIPRGDAGPPPAPAAGRASSRYNLRTPLTSFVGREDEVSRVGAALDGYRLVTLVGPGGAGKTRLALEVAGHIAARGREGAPDGIWMAELASVTDPSDVPHAVLGSVGLRESRLMLDGTQRVTTRDAQTRLLEGLADARALLVLDNCEHLIDACAHLADVLLAHSPRLRIVATSREPLGITGESLLVVPPLGQDPAIRLFRDRAAAVSPGFELDDEATPLVADIVRRLDGLPLAIELAAARLRTLPLAEVSRRLDDRFRLLTGGSRTALPRHRTLRAVVEWSWDLLTADERLLAERFAVFPAGATPEAAAAVCGYDKLDGADIDELLSSLVDKSLLEPVADGTRLRMLETIREYGSEQVALRGAQGAPELGDLRRRHAEYYSDFMDRATPELLTRDQVIWLPVVRADRDNILAALRHWCDAAEADRAITLAVTMCTLALLLGNHADMADLMDQVLGVPGDADPGLRTISEALYKVSRAMRLDANGPGGPQPGLFPGPLAGEEPDLSDRVDAIDIAQYPLAGLLRCVYAVFDGGPGGERLRRYLDEAMASENEWIAAAAWMFSAAMAENDGDLDTMRSASAEALARFRALGERWGLSSALRNIGSVRLLDGDLDGAAAAFAEAGRALEEMGSRDDETFIKMRLADIAIRRGDLDAARRFYEEAWTAAGTDGSLTEQAMAATWGAMFEATQGRTEEARPLLAVAEHGLAQVDPAHPVRQHMDALVAAAAVMIAINDADLPAAGDKARAAYDAAVKSKDMPLLAMASGCVVELARALGQHERAAEMLGATSAVRGGEDLTDPMTARLAARLTEALGPDRYTAAYARGRNLDRADAISRLDPAGLLPRRQLALPSRLSRPSLLPCQHYQHHKGSIRATRPDRSPLSATSIRLPATDSYS